MNYIKFFKFTIAISAVFLIVQTPAIAATIPLPDVGIVIKSITTGRVIISNTDKNGSFSSSVPEETGEYNVFLNDQSLAPFKMKAKNGVISGRVVVLTEGTTTQDPLPVKVKKTVPVKISKPIKPIKKATSTSL